MSQPANDRPRSRTRQVLVTPLFATLPTSQSLPQSEAQSQVWGHVAVSVSSLAFYGS